MALRNGLSEELNRQGNEHFARGHYTDAYACYAKALECDRLTGDHRALSATLGNLAGSVGAAKVSGSSSSWELSGDLQIGNLGEGILSVEQGGLLSTSNATLGTLTDAGQSTAQVTGSGSRWQSAGKS